MDLWRFALAIGVGFVIGYAHTGVAIVMLFRPFQEVRFLGVRLQGMIPRRRAEMARSVARIFTSDLLREEAVAARIAGPDVRRAFEALAGDLLGRWLDRDWGTLRRALGSQGERTAERVLEGMADELGRAARDWLASPAGAAVLRSAAALLLERSPAQLLPGEEAVFSRFVAGRVLDAVAAPGLEERLTPWLGLLGGRLGSTTRPLGELLPAEVREALLGVVRGSVPSLLKGFERALLTPPNVERLKAAVRSGVRAYLLEAEGGFLKNLLRRVALLGRDRVLREVDAVVDANLYRLGELVFEEENRAHVEAGVCEALEALFRRSPADLLGALPAGTAEALAGSAAVWAAERLRRPQAAEALGRALRRELDRLFETPLKELAALAGAPGDPADRLAAAAGRWAAEGGVEVLVRRERRALAALLLDAPLGRPSRLLSREAQGEVVALGFDHLMPAVAAKVPEILRIVDVEGLIEGEVLRLPPRDLERVIVSVARRELRAIAWWGGVLGALVGGVQGLLQRLAF